MGDANRTVLVTGGAGFIGSHTCKALSRSDFLPITYDNLSTGHAEAVRWGPLYHGDVRDVLRLTEVLQETRAVAVLHFAASAYVGESMTDPQKYYRNNVGGMTALLDALNVTGVNALVLSSSCATYGEPEVSPIDEETPQRPINPYGRTKLICEEMIGDYGRAKSLNYAILRYFNAAGADPEGDLVEHHSPETHLIPCILMAALGLSQEIRIFGNEYPTPDGTCIRDFIHVTDIAQGHTLALNSLLSGKKSFTVNLGTGHGSSILDVIRACEACVGHSIPQRIVDGRIGDPPVLIANVARARAILGFEPNHSDLATIVRTAFTALQKVHGRGAAGLSAQPRGQAP